MLRILLFASLLTVLACSSKTDSGTSIHSDELPSIALSERLRIDEFGEGKLFGGVNSMHRKSNGNFLVYDAQQSHLFEFDLNGTHIRTIGRLGKGPGEFDRFQSISVSEKDSIYLYKFQSSAVAVLKPDGSLAREQSIPRQGRAFFQGAFATKNGRLFTSMIPNLFLATNHPYLKEIGIRHGFLSTLTEMDTVNVLHTPMQPTHPLTTSQFSIDVPIPFGVTTIVSTGPRSDIYAVKSDTLVVTRYDANFKVLQTFGLGLAKIPLSKAEYDSTLAQQASGWPGDMGKDLISALSGKQPPYRTLVDRLTIGYNNTLWLRIHVPGLKNTQRYVVFTEDGKLLGRLDLPSGHTLLLADEKHIYTWFADEASVMVYEYRL